MGEPVDPDYIAELFVEFGPVSVRRMFSGAGIFADGLMIGLMSRGVIYLKADAQTIPAFETEGLAPFGYDTKDGRRTINSYWRMPERLYDEPEELARWTRAAQEAARRSAAPQRKTSPAKRRPAVGEGIATKTKRRSIRRGAPSTRRKQRD